MSAGDHDETRLVLVGGHESDDGADLGFLRDALPGVIVSPAGRVLHNTVSALLASGDAPVAVLPMTFGRNPTMVADVAKTLKWLSTGDGAGRVVLCDDFGAIDHLIAWLRKAATETAKRRPEAALVITARSSNPFDDAELYRVAHLVRTHGAGLAVEVACVEEDAEVGEAVRRARLLGAEESVVVPAGFARTSTAPWGSGELLRATFYGPLMSEQAILQVVRQRLAAAQHSLSHGHDGIETGLLADHGHGYAHSHAFEESQGGHPHPHPHPHPHSHPHGGGDPSHTPVNTAHGHDGKHHEPPAAHGATNDEVLTHRH
jgi:hypothetical protein